MLSLLTTQISFCDCFYSLEYSTLCVLQLFVNQVVNVINFEINLIFLIKSFLYMTKTWRQNPNYIVNEKSF